MNKNTNKFLTFKYKKFESSIIIDGREVKYIPLYRFYEFGLIDVKVQIKGLRELPFFKIAAYMPFREEFQPLCGVNSALVFAYNRLIVDYSINNDCDAYAAYDYFNGLTWRTIAMMIDVKLNQYQVFFYPDQSVTYPNDWDEAEEAGVLLLLHGDSHRLQNFILNTPV